MKNLRLAVVLGGFLCGPAAWAAKDVDAELRGASFGDDVTSLKGLKPAGDPDGTVQLYKRDSDTLTYRGVELETILYGVDGGKLAFVEMWGASAEGALEPHCDDAKSGSAKALHAAVRKTFGSPVRPAVSTFLDGAMDGAFAGYESILPLCGERDDCTITRYERKGEPRGMTATVVTLEVFRPRKLSTKELEAMRKDPSTVKLDTYDCQSLVRFEPGPAQRK